MLELTIIQMLVHLRVQLAVNEVVKSSETRVQIPHRQKIQVVYTHLPKPLVRKVNRYMSWWEITETRWNSRDAHKRTQTPNCQKNLCCSNSSNIQLGVCWILQKLCILEDRHRHNIIFGGQSNIEKKNVIACASINHSVFYSFLLLSEKD